MSSRSRRGAKRKADDSDSKDDKMDSSASNLFQGLEFVYGSKLDGYTAAAFASLIKEHGGTVNSSRNLPDSVNYVVVKGVDTQKAKDAVSKDINVVNEQWLEDSIQQKTLLDDDKYFTHKKSAASTAPTTAANSANSASASNTTSSSSSSSSSADANGDDGDADDDDGGNKKKKARKGSSASTKSKAKFKGKGKSKTASADDDDDGDADDGDDSPAPAPKSEPKIKTVVGHSTSSGAQNLVIPVNEHFPVGNVHVFVESDGTIWDALLNQVDIGNNNNKYYIVQLLQSNDGKKYYTWTIWGRVGAVAGKANFDCGGNLESAKKQFRAKFKDKTKNEWDNRDNFVTVKGKYTLIHRNYSADSDDMDEDKDDGADSKKAKKEKQPSKLDPRVRDLIALIANKESWKAQLVEIGYDANKLPLGRLSEKTVKAGYEALQRLATAIDNHNDKACLALSNEFYTHIPHATPLNVRPPVINTPQMLKAKLELVESLADIEVANKVLKGVDDSDLNELDAQYERLNCQLTPVDKKSSSYKMVEHYFANTHAPTHTNYKLKVLDVLEVNREGEAERFKTMEHIGNRQLLFHGSRLTNFVGILSQGLRIAPPEAPATGYMFGKGVYLADSMSKSANYCFASTTASTACMLLCEAALGEMNPKYHADYNAATLPHGKWSTKGIGRSAPDPKESVTIDDGKVTVPTGRIIDQAIPGADLLYNEYIVYNVAQVKIRYVVKVQFDYTRGGW